jgi:hypothetical protein
VALNENQRSLPHPHRDGEESKTLSTSDVIKTIHCDATMVLCTTTMPQCTDNWIQT